MEEFGSKYLQYKYSNTFRVSDEVHVCPDFTNYCNVIASGRFNKIDGSEDYKIFYDSKYIYSRHVIFILI